MKFRQGFYSLGKQLKSQNIFNKVNCKDYSLVFVKFLNC